MAMTEDDLRSRQKGRPSSSEAYSNLYPIGEKLDLLSMPEPNSGCVLWIGALTEHGYGRVKVRSRFRKAHIVSFEHSVGAVPAGLDLDHKCRVRCCINPAHLEPVTRLENLRRGIIARGLTLRKLR